MASHVDTLDISASTGKVDRVDLVPPQNVSFTDVQIARLAIGECGSDMVHRALSFIGRSAMLETLRARQPPNVIS